MPEGKVLGGKMRHKIELSQYSTQAITVEYEHHWTLTHRQVKFNSRNKYDYLRITSQKLLTHHDVENFTTTPGHTPRAPNEKYKGLDIGEGKHLEPVKKVRD